MTQLLIARLVDRGIELSWTENDRFVAKDRFSKIYAENEWGKGSGPGSSPGNTIEYRQFLQAFLRQNSIKSVLDLGCGDWQIASLMDWSGVHYTGIDVVDEVVMRNAEEYGSDTVRFVCDDVSECELPVADLIILKDVLQHWPTDVILEFLPRLEQVKYALLTNDNYPHVRLNGDPDDSFGHFRPVDMAGKPFNLKGDKIFHFRTNQKMPEGFKNKEVFLLKSGR